MLRHPHGGDHRIEGENDVEQQNLHDDICERGSDAFGDFAVFTFQFFVNFKRAFAEEKETAENQNYIFYRDREFEGVARSLQKFIHPKRLVELHHPGEHREQQNSRDERETQTKTPRFFLLITRQFSAENGNENDVVDAENNFQQRERRQANPYLGVRKQVHRGIVEKECDVSTEGRTVFPIDSGNILS